MLSGSLLVGNLVAGTAAAAQMQPKPAATVTRDRPSPSPETDKVVAEATVHAVQFLANHALHIVRPHHHKPPVTNANNAFTPDWWRCVITPESSGNFDDTSGGYGILISTWHAYGMSGVPGDYPRQEQAKVALEIYDDNGGFGPGAWNNSANCGKDG